MGLQYNFGQASLHLHFQLSGCWGLEITEQKPTCWKCSKTGHLIPSYPENKTSGVCSPANQNLPLVDTGKSVTPVVGMLVAGIGVVKSLFGLPIP